MQDMQASFNYLFISWFGCICDMQMCCKTCKFTDFLACLAMRFFYNMPALSAMNQ